MPIFYIVSENQQAVISAPVGAVPLTTLQAIEGPTSGNVSLRDTTSEAYLWFDTPYASYVRQDEVTPWGVDAPATVNNINAAITAGSETGPGAVPAILWPTAGQTIQVIDGENVNIQVVGDAVVEWNWPILVRDLIPSSNDRSVLIGRPSGGIGVYATEVTGANVNGVVVRNFNIEVVAAGGFQNLRSIRLNSGVYAEGVPTTSHPFWRSTDGPGAPDWSFSCWVRPNGTGSQTLVAFGDSGPATGAGVQIVLNANQRRVEVRMGEWTGNSNVRMRTATNSIPASPAWSHVFVVYDGGSTSSTADVISNNRVQVYIDGVLSALTSDGGSGYTGGWGATYWRYGVAPDGDGASGILIDEPATWASDERARVAEIYNLGAPRDLNALPTAPRPYTWHRGDGVPGGTFPTIAEASTVPSPGGNVIFYNGVEGDFLNAVP